MKQNCILLSIYISLSFLCMSCSPSPGNAIERVLNQCAKNTAYVNSSNMNAAQAADYLASSMQSIDVRNCPQDFRIAFQEHINAWRQASGVFAQNTPLNSFLEGFASGILQDPSFLGASERQAAYASYRINETYNELVRIAAMHGARIPESVVRR